MTHDRGPGSGERRLQDSRKRYRNIITGLLVAGGINGMVLGVALGRHFGRRGFHDMHFPPHIQWLAIAGAVAFVLSVGIGSYIYFGAIDELELEANKLAGIVGLNVYGLLFMTWWPLAKVGVLPDPDGEAIFLATMASAIAAFCWRRFR